MGKYGDKLPDMHKQIDKLNKDYINNNPDKLNAIPLVITGMMRHALMHCLLDLHEQGAPIGEIQDGVTSAIATMVMLALDENVDKIGALRASYMMFAEAASTTIASIYEHYDNENRTIN